MSRPVAFRINDLSIADHIVGHDHRTGTRQLQRPFQILRITFFIGIDEDQIEWREGGVFQRWKIVDRAANVQLDAVQHARVAQIFARGVLA